MKSTIEICLDRAGRLLMGPMCRVRYLRAPIELVWEAISTKEDLEKWWVAPPRVFDLKVGGLFNHHWDNTITSYKKLRYIDLDEPRDSYRGTSGRRIKLA